MIAFLIGPFLINRYYWVFLIIYSDSSFTSRAKPKPLGSQGKDHLCSNIIPPCSRLRLLLLLYLLTLAPVGAVHYIPLVYNKVNKITGFQSGFDLKNNNYILKKFQNIIVSNDFLVIGSCLLKIFQKTLNFMAQLASPLN